MCRNMVVLIKAYRNYYTKLWIVNIDHKKTKIFLKSFFSVNNIQIFRFAVAYLKQQIRKILYIIPIYPNNLIFQTYACKKNDKQLYLY